MTVLKSLRVPWAILLLAGVLLGLVSLTIYGDANVWAPVPLPVSQRETPARRRALWATQRYCTPPQLPTPPLPSPPATEEAAAAAQPHRRLAAVKVSKSLLASLASQSAGPGRRASPTRAPPVWQEIAGLIGQSARRHGLQQKAGPPANYESAMQHMVNMQREGSVGQPVTLTPSITSWLHRVQR
jgi:hypothetical protein